MGGCGGVLCSWMHRMVGGRGTVCLRGYRSAMLSLSLGAALSSLDMGSQKASLGQGGPSLAAWSSRFFLLCRRQAGTYSTPCL